MKNVICWKVRSCWSEIAAETLCITKRMGVASRLLPNT